jgi:hypothetical protein
MHPTTSQTLKGFRVLQCDAERLGRRSQVKLGNEIQQDQLSH